MIMPQQDKMKGQLFRPGILYCLLLFLLAGSALALRTLGLTNTGVGGNDTILYYTLAEHWFEGKYVFQIGDSIQVFRPALLAFYALALELIGHVDYAIKLANSIVDSINVLLVAALAWLLSGRLAVSFCSALVYALLPVAIWSARGELPHTLSTFFVLCSLVFAVLACGKIRYPFVLATLSGIFIAAAALTHEELILLALPLGIFVANPLALRDRTLLPAASIRLGCFLLAPICAALVILRFESAALEVLSAPATMAEESRGYFSTTGRYLWNVL